MYHLRYNLQCIWETAKRNFNVHWVGKYFSQRLKPTILFPLSEICVSPCLLCKMNTKHTVYAHVKRAIVLQNATCASNDGFLPVWLLNIGVNWEHRKKLFDPEGQNMMLTINFFPPSSSTVGRNNPHLTLFRFGQLPINKTDSGMWGTVHCP